MDTIDSGPAVGQRIDHAGTGTETDGQSTQAERGVNESDNPPQPAERRATTTIVLYGSVQNELVATAPDDLDAAIDKIIGALRAFRTRTWPQRMEEGELLYNVQEKCKKSGRRDFTEIIVKQLNYARQTAYDLIADFKKHTGIVDTKALDVSNLPPKADADAELRREMIRNEQNIRQGRKPERADGNARGFWTHSMPPANFISTE